MSRDLLPGVTGVLALADGTVLQGIGVGAVGEAVGEVCFNTAMTGYQEILTDPSYMDQIVTFTFPTSATPEPICSTSNRYPVRRRPRRAGRSSAMRRPRRPTGGPMAISTAGWPAAASSAWPASTRAR